jgi:hypothetical protein
MPLDAGSFRRLALSLPEAVEEEHMGHPDFRVRGRIFATLGHPGPGWGMIKLTPEQQQMFVDAEPGIFSPVKGGWGARGATSVELKAASVRTLRPAMEIAFRNVAPRTVARLLDGGASKKSTSKESSRKRARKKPARRRRSS